MEILYWVISITVFATIVYYRAKTEIKIKKEFEDPIRDEWSKLGVKFVVYFKEPLYINQQTISSYTLYKTFSPKFYTGYLEYTLKQKAIDASEDILRRPLRVDIRDHRGVVVPKHMIEKVNWYILPKDVLPKEED